MRVATKTEQVALNDRQEEALAAGKRLLLQAQLKCGNCWNV
jgi:hypothetical protein